MNDRILCLDVGDARIGVAVSDPTRLIASPVEVIQSVGWGPDSRRVAELCAAYDTCEVLCGLPLNMDGTEGFQAKKVRNFCAQLEKLGLIVYYQDERLTTVTATGALLEANVSRAGRKKVVDKVAAVVILQQWLDEQRMRQTSKEDNQMADERNEGFEEDYENDGLIELTDDEGNSVSFELLATLNYDGKDYLALSPADEDEDGEETSVLFMEVVEDGEDEYYEAVEEDELLDRLFDKLGELMEDAMSDEGEED